MRIGGTMALALALVVSGCGTADYVTDSKASVLLLVGSVNAARSSTRMYGWAPTATSSARTPSRSTWRCETRIPTRRRPGSRVPS